MTNGARIEAVLASAPPTTRRATSAAKARHVLTPAGLAALTATGPSCERLPWPLKPCGRDAGHRGSCRPLL